MTTMPTFNFRSTVTEEEIKKDQEASGKEPKMFKPGTYDLKIVSAEYHQPMSGDQSWLGYKIQLGGVDSRSIRMYLAVPTSGPYYNKPGSKPSMFMFHKFREFVKALGEDPSVDSLNRTINKLFKDPSVLVKEVVTVDIGYKRHYAEFVEKGVFKLVDKSGTAVTDETFPDKDSVIAYGASQNLIVDSFTEVLKLHPKAKKEVNQTEGW